MTRDIAPLSTLPVIIDGPGEYVTRGGGRVSIREVAPASSGNAAFNARGAMWRTVKGITRARGVDVWHVSGRYLVLREDERDIVGRKQEEASTAA